MNFYRASWLAVNFLVASGQAQASNSADANTVASMSNVADSKLGGNRVPFNSAAAKAKKHHVKHRETSVIAHASNLLVSVVKPAIGARNSPAHQPSTVANSTQRAVQDSTDLNNGRDITRPEHRVDIFFNSSGSGDGSRSGTTTLRYERPFTLDDAWKISFRVEPP